MGVLLPARPVHLQDLASCAKAFNLLPGPSIWEEMKTLSGILKEELASQALAGSVCHSQNWAPGQAW